jgi:hypothetical protein
MQHTPAQKNLGDLRNDAVEFRVATRFKAARTRQVDIKHCSILPGRGDMTTTRSASKTASSMLCVIKRTVFRPLSHSCSRSTRICSRVSASSAPKGSSIISTGGSWINRAHDGGALPHAAGQLARHSGRRTHVEPHICAADAERTTRGRPMGQIARAARSGPARCRARCASRAAPALWNTTPRSV